MEYAVIWDSLADRDLAEISSYITYQDLAPAAAVKLITKIRKEGNGLSHSPHYCPFYNKKMGIRKYIVGKYLILFTVDEEKRIVNIRQVVRGNRDLPKVVR
jgi:plasmid stabilization system protein ParE